LLNWIKTAILEFLLAAQDENNIGISACRARRKQYWNFCLPRKTKTILEFLLAAQDENPYDSIQLGLKLRQRKRNRKLHFDLLREIKLR